ncbi:MAG: hypothetical protein AAGA48_37405 [Myxococcota bacterium]
MDLTRATSLPPEPVLSSCMTDVERVRERFGKDLDPDLVERLLPHLEAVEGGLPGSEPLASVLRDLLQDHADFGAAAFRRLLERGPVPTRWIVGAATYIAQTTGVPTQYQLLNLLAETGQLGDLPAALRHWRAQDDVRDGGVVEEHAMLVERTRDAWAPTRSRLEWSGWPTSGGTRREQTPRAALIQAVRQDPHNDAAWSVLADLLEGSDPLHAKAIRRRGRQGWEAGRAATDRYNETFRSADGVLPSWHRGFVTWTALPGGDRLVRAANLLEHPVAGLLDTLVLHDPWPEDAAALAKLPPSLSAVQILQGADPLRRPDMLAALAQSPLAESLEVLHLSGLTGPEGLARFQQATWPALRTLRLEHHASGDSVIGNLPPTLRRLGLRATGLTDDGAARLARWSGISNVIELSLGNNPISGAGLAELLPRAPQLLSLDLDRAQLTDAALSLLCEAPWAKHLRRLRVVDTGITAEALLSRLEAFPNLRDLALTVRGTSVTLAALVQRTLPTTLRMIRAHFVGRWTEHPWPLATPWLTDEGAHIAFDPWREPLAPLAGTTTS